jgi:hypothetical protein
VTLAPKPSNLITTIFIPGSAQLDSNAGWVTAEDLFAELHRQTGRNVIADDYLRVYPRKDFQFQNARLLDVLNDVADALKSDWQPDGDFLRFRRFDDYTERTLDIPNRLLEKWVADRQGPGLTLDDLAEMAALPDEALDRPEISAALQWKLGLNEGWSLASMARKSLRFYALLTPEQRQKMKSSAGIALSEMNPDQVAQARQLLKRDDSVFYSSLSPVSPNRREETIPLTPDLMAKSRSFIRLREPGLYEWYETDAKLAWNSEFPLQAPVSEKTRAEAEAALERLLKSRGASPKAISDAKAAIAGPKIGVLSRLQVGTSFRLEMMNRDRGNAIPGFSANLVNGSL